MQIDHLVFGTDDLDKGTAWMMRKLGVAPGGSGKHPQMGTHNSLWRLGSAYLEVIAIDPDAPAPEHPRWFGLDDHEIREAFSFEPALLTWVLRTGDIDAAIAASPTPTGPARRFTRDQLHWQLTVPTTGHLTHRGTFPALIQWPDDPDVVPPFRALPDTGLRITRLAITGPPAAHKALKLLGVGDLYEHHLVEMPPRMEITLSGSDGQEPVMFRSF